MVDDDDQLERIQQGEVVVVVVDTDTDIAVGSVDCHRSID